MSGCGINLLVRECEDRAAAINAADSAIEKLFSDGQLGDGDRGSVDAEEDGDGEAVHAADDVERFLGKLRELQNARKAQYGVYIRRAREACAENRIPTLEDVPLEEEASETHSVGMIGYYLEVAGLVQGRSWTKHAVLWDAEDHQGGVSAERIAEIRKSPAGWWLVECTVG